MKKTLITILATVLVCCCVVGGTLAWLMDSTQTVTNTFTVGNVDITLTEKGTETTAESFSMVPGRVIPKDPKVTVKVGSEACWLFVKIKETNNTFGDAQNSQKFVTYAIAGGWTLLEESEGVYVYWRSVTADQIAAGAEYSVLAGNQVTANSNATATDFAALGENKPALSFTAYAVQSEGVADAATAWGYLPTT